MIIETAYYGPTNYRGSRIAAATGFGDWKVNAGYDYSASDAHRAALDTLLAEILPAGAVPVILTAGDTANGKGYRYVILDGPATVDAGIAACDAAGVAHGSIIVPVHMSCPCKLDAGERVAFAAHTDEFVRGDRFGTVSSVKGTRVHAKTDSGRSASLRRGDVSQIGTRGHAWDFVGSPVLTAGE